MSWSFCVIECPHIQLNKFSKFNRNNCCENYCNFVIMTLTTEIQVKFANRTMAWRHILDMPQRLTFKSDDFDAMWDFVIVVAD